MFCIFINKTCNKNNFSVYLFYFCLKYKLKLYIIEKSNITQPPKTKAELSILQLYFVEMRIHSTSHNVQVKSCNFVIYNYFLFKLQITN